jgi:outer membrane protein TolC
MRNIYFSPGTARVLLLNACLLCLTLVAAAQNKKNSPSTSPAAVSAPPIEDTSKVSLLQPVKVGDTSKNGGGQYFNLQQCIDYALQHQPGVNISLINIDVAKATNDIALSGLLPQVNASGSLIHNIQQPPGTNTTTVSTTGATTSSAGSTNVFVPGIVATQNIFNPSLIYAAKSAPLYMTQAKQISDSTKINTVVAVTTSYYTLLNNLEQINVLKEDTAEFGKSLRDAYHQYVGGIVDETDYEQAQITLNNTMAQLKQANENVVPQYANLKQLMGYPVDKQFNVLFDTAEMKRDINIDTTEQMQFEKRIEFQLLNTSKSLQDQTINYYRYYWLPTLSAFFNYNLNYSNNNLGNLFSNSYPTSLIGASFSIPIFTGFYRINNLRKAKLQAKILDWTQDDLKAQINTQYTTALANYKGNYYNLRLLQKNVTLSKRVYFVVTLQYRQGIVPYLNVITAETNLITSEINYLNSLFQVLANKVALQQAMGTITY